MEDLVEGDPVLFDPLSDFHSGIVYIQDRATFDYLCGLVLPVDLLAQTILQCFGVVVFVHVIGK